jgi:putative RNA 2'-phosphotransferase
MADVRRSKRLSYWLRHAPEAAGVELDARGWAPVEAILAALGKAGLPTGRDDLAQLVAASDKQRFELSADGERIRARQGHSVTVEGDWPVTEPPDLLYHGTTDRFLLSILKKGLLPGRRHHVHLSATVETAQAVGARRGKAVVLGVLARAAAESGLAFRLSSNGVWLTDHVPPEWLRRRC